MNIIQSEACYREALEKIMLQGRMRVNQVCLAPDLFVPVVITGWIRDLADIASAALTRGQAEDKPEPRTETTT